MTVDVTLIDYSNTQQSDDLVYLLNCYALDDMGKGTPLSDQVRQTLIDELARRPHAFSIIAYVDGKAAALANCFELFSTFAGRPLINIHDIYVHDDYRGQGLSHVLLAKVDAIARQKNCCKITLEVLQGNEPAKQSYQKFGFKGYELDPALGAAMFWEKAL